MNANHFYETNLEEFIKQFLDPNSVLKQEYEKNKIGRLEPHKNAGIGVSTCNTDDEGYETALLDVNGAWPVERYKNKKNAVAGHAKWIKLSQELEYIDVLESSESEGGRIKLKRITYH